MASETKGGGWLGGGLVGMPYTEVDRWTLHPPRKPPWTAEVTFQTRAGPEASFVLQMCWAPVSCSWLGLLQQS